ncbi:MAG: PhoU domain-containing protein [Planctomycetota bacterium]
MKTPAIYLSILATSVASLCAQEPTVAEQLQEMQERIDELEELQAETSERVEGRALLRTFSAMEIDLGGHVTSIFSHIEGVADSATGHQLTLLELFLKARISDEWSIFAAPAFFTFNGALLDNPASPTVAGDPFFSADTSSSPNITLGRAYAEYSPYDELRIQGGVIGSLHGTTNREYFISARNIVSASLHTRVFTANQLFPQVLRGVKASGKLMQNGSQWFEYDIYAGVDSISAAEPLSGLRVAFACNETGLTVAANVGQGTRSAAPVPGRNFGVVQSPFPVNSFLEHDYRFGGIDVDWRNVDFMVRGEAYYSAEDGLLDQRALSVESTWFASAEWGLSYRFDYYDAGSDLNPLLPTPAILDRGTSTEHAFGLMYEPDPSVRLRLDFHHNNLPSTDDTVQYVNLSWTVSF